VLRVEVTELKSRPSLLGACTTCPVLHEKLAESRSRIVLLEAELEALLLLLFLPVSCMLFRIWRFPILLIACRMRTMT
jgi:hypothetical protein